MLSKNVENFIGCDSAFLDANMVLFGAGYDGTTSYRPGARFAGGAIRHQSFGIETYSPYIDRTLDDIRVFDGGELELPFGDPVPILEIIYNYTKEVLSSNKIPFMVGGEHLVTLGAFKAVYEKYNDVSIIHFDAHTDLREQYLGAKLSHASVIKRCYDLVGDNRIYQFGIRSGDKEEFLWSKNRTYMQQFNLDTLSDICKKLAGKPVYFTLDLDVLDSGIFPATGTPEAGGISYMELIHAIDLLGTLDIVGCDMVELSPPYDSTGASTALACTVLREMLLSFVHAKEPA